MEKFNKLVGQGYQAAERVSVDSLYAPTALDSFRRLSAPRQRFVEPFDRMSVDNALRNVARTSRRDVVHLASLCRPPNYAERVQG
jgi:hypothetical protein